MNIPVLNVWDETQNKYVGIPAISGGGGGATSWNDLTDKPFGESPTGGDTLTWDGNTEGLETLAEGSPFFRVSDSVLEVSDFVGASLLWSDGLGVSIDEAMVNDSEGPVGVYYAEMPYIYSVDATVAEQIGCAPGLYFLNTGGDGYTASLTIPGYTGFPVTKQIDPAYIPPLTQEQLPAGYPWDGRTVIEWDGNTEGLETLEMPESNPLYKVSDMVLTENDIKANGYTVTFSSGKTGGSGNFLVATEESIMFVILDTMYVIMSGTAEAFSNAGLDLPTGTYFGTEIGGFGNVSSITYGTTTPISETLLPEGYPNKENTLITVNKREGALDGVPAFAIGDTVTIIVDGVEHTLVAFSDYGYPAIGDTYEEVSAGSGEFGWEIWVRDGVSIFFARDVHAISYPGVFITPLAEEFLPAVAKGPLIITLDNDGNYTANKTFDEAYKICTSGTAPAFVTFTLDGMTKQFWGFREGLYGESKLKLTFIASNDAKRTICYDANNYIYKEEEES